MTLAELEQTIKQIGIGANPESPLLNSDVLIELVLPRVLNKVVADVVRDEQQLNALRADHTLSVVSGQVSCPSNIKEEYADSITFPSSPLTSYRPTRTDYAQGSDLFDTFFLANQKIYFRQAGLSAATYTSAITLNAITLPTMPVSAAATVSIKANILEQVITYTASLIRGEIPLQEIGLDNAAVSKKA
jgi:hypothetical protein